MCKAASLLHSHAFRFAAFSLFALSTPAVCARRGSCARNLLHSDASVANCCLRTCSRQHALLQGVCLSALFSLPSWQQGCPPYLFGQQALCMCLRVSSSGSCSAAGKARCSSCYLGISVCPVLLKVQLILEGTRVLQLLQGAAWKH